MPCSRPEAALLHATERRFDVHARGRVDREHPGLDAPGDPQRPADVAGPDRSATARRPSRWPGRRPRPRRRRARSPTIGPNSSCRRKAQRRVGVGEDGRLEVEAGPVRLARPHRSARLPVRPHRRRVRSPRRGARPDQRARVGSPRRRCRRSVIDRVASAKRSTNSVVDRPFDEHAAPGAAVLAGVVEDRPQRRCDAGVEVGVGEHEVGRLAAELERDPRDVLSGHGHDRRYRPRSSR